MRKRPGLLGLLARNTKRRKTTQALMAKMNIEGVLYACVHAAIKLDEKKQSLEEMDTLVLADAITDALRRLTYDMYHRLRRIGQKIRQADLVALLNEVKQIFEENYEVECEFDKLIDKEGVMQTFFWEVQLTGSSQSEEVGVDHANSLALKAVLAKEDTAKVKADIDGFIAEVQSAIGMALIEDELRLVLGVFAEGMELSHQQRLNMLSDFQQLFGFLFTEIARICDERFLDNDVILANKSTVKQIIPKLLPEYDPLLERHAVAFLKLIKGKIGMIVFPNAESIWQALISLYFRNLEREIAGELPSLDEEPVELDFGLFSGENGNFGPS